MPNRDNFPEVFERLKAILAIPYECFSVGLSAVHNCVHPPRAGA